MTKNEKKEKIISILREVSIARKDYNEYIDALADKLILNGVVFRERKNTDVKEIQRGNDIV